VTEEWRAVPGYEGRYEVSDLGRVRKYADTHSDGDGYPCVSMGRRGAPRLPVHCMVALAFLGPRPQGAVVRHLNDDPRDARLANLRYGSRAENFADAVRNGLVDLDALRANARLQAPKGGSWWRGRRRLGQRGKAAP
jgi:hypothetical protein